jgi:hypothetical protein
METTGESDLNTVPTVEVIGLCSQVQRLINNQLSKMIPICRLLVPMCIVNHHHLHAVIMYYLLASM